MSIFFTITAAFIAALGLAVGSFLNVVIYRLPNGISLARPRWSFCPHCGESIAGCDNLPVISWLLLRGRCRKCKAPIGGQYPIVEAMTALVFTLVYFLLISQSSRAGLTPHAWVEFDWPYVLACLTLAAAMIACSAMDLTSYSLDVRVTEFAVVIGVLMHAAWRRSELHMPLAPSAWGAAGTAATLAAFVMLWISSRRLNEAPAGPPSETPDHHDDPTAEEPQVEQAAAALAADRAAGRGPILLAIVSMLALTVLVIASGALGDGRTAHQVRSWIAPLGIAIIYIITVLAGSGHTSADAQVHDEIEFEARFARRVALSELLWLVPAILAGAAAFFAVAQIDAIGDIWRNLTHWSPYLSLRPIAGLAYALCGLAIAAALGWVLRLFFTLAFGREAFGTGDIYILAAAGATIGPDLAALGLLAAVALAMVAWLLAQMQKSTTLLPFGPPLAIGFLVALWLSRPAAEVAESYLESIRIAATEQPRLLWLLGGILVIGMGAAILAAKAVRRLVEPGQSDPPLDPPTTHEQ